MDATEEGEVTSGRGRLRMEGKERGQIPLEERKENVKKAHDQNKR